MPTRYLELWHLGVRKKAHEDFDGAEAAGLLATARGIAAEMAAAGAEAGATATEAHGAAARQVG